MVYNSKKLDYLAKKSAKPRICFDFDGVLHSYIHPYKGDDVIPDPPCEGIANELEQLKDKYQLWVFTTRANSASGYAAVVDWLKKYDLYKYFNGCITYEKIPALVYVDDRAIRFEGNWKGIAKAIENFQPWNRRK